MNTSTLLTTLETNKNRNLNFQLPDGTHIGGDLHITEIKNQDIDSVDCGGNVHSFKETVIQLWVNEHSTREADWTVGKALSIIQKIDASRPIEVDSDLYIEYGDTAHSAAKYKVHLVEESADELTLGLSINPTACKPNLQATETTLCC
ncbi:MAG: hypothetical protein FH748_03495 [Balneolaceae bacterium]|nr:hypothetical protein [Balneolaceae bacterium]